MIHVNLHMSVATGGQLCRKQAARRKGYGQ